MPALIDREEQKPVMASSSNEGHELEEEVSTQRPEQPKCGCFCWAPSSLQHLARPRVFFLAMCFFTAIDGIAVGMFTGTLTTVEAHFQLSLTEIGSMTTVFCLGAIFGILLALYLGAVSRSHIPCLLAVSAAVYGLGMILFTIPSFLQDPYFPPSLASDSDESTSSVAEENETVCFKGVFAEDCPTASRQTTLDFKVYKIAFYLGSFIQGVGIAVYPIGLSYIAECTSPGTTAMYIGVINAVLGIWPVIGVTLAAAFIGIWVDFYRQDEETYLALSPSDPEWIGAWWLGFIVTAVLLFFASALFVLFPSRMPPPHKMAGNSEPNERPGAKDHRFLNVKEFALAIWTTLKNPHCMLTCLSQSTFYFIMYGYGVFVPKYLEDQFGYDRQTSDLLTGVILAPAYAIGELFAGFLVKKLDLTRRGIIRLTCCVLTVCVVGMALLMVIGCDNNNVAGVFTGYDGVKSPPVQVSLEAPCNQNCSCSLEVYAPVCDTDGLVTYFSACHASCKRVSSNGSFTDCACLVRDDYANKFPDTERLASVKEGACGTSCKMAAPFLIVLTVVFISATFSDLLRLTVIVRSVPSEGPLVGFSVAYLMQVIGSTPSGQVFGSVIDSSCAVWQQSCQGGEFGACLLYDNNAYRFAYNGLALGMAVFSAAVMFIVLCLPDRNHTNMHRVLSEMTDKKEING